MNEYKINKPAIISYIIFIILAIASIILTGYVVSQLINNTTILLNNYKHLIYVLFVVNCILIIIAAVLLLGDDIISFSNKWLGYLLLVVGGFSNSFLLILSTMSGMSIFAVVLNLLTIFAGIFVTIEPIRKIV